MGCETFAEQIAKALGKSIVNNSDFIGVVVNDTLYRVTIGDLATSLGLTGQIESLDDNAVAILTGTAPNYQIRGINGGDGISAQLNTLNNVTINARLNNAGNSLNGERLLKNTTGDELLFKRIKAGNGIQLVSESDNIVIENQQSVGTSKTKLVSSIDDFPTPVAGVITLNDNTEYLLVNDIATSNRFVFGANTVLASSGYFGPTLTYTGVNTMLTLSDGNQEIREIALNCPNGTLIDGSNGTNGFLVMRWLYIPEVKNLGVIDKDFTVFLTSVILLITGQGFQYNALADRIFTAIDINMVATTFADFVFFDLGNATFRDFGLTLISFRETLSTQTFLKGAAAGGNISAGAIGYVERVTIDGDMAALDTISVNDAGWDFASCNKIADTDPHCLISLDATAVTTISAAGVPVQVNGVFSEYLAQVYESESAGIIRYKGRREKFARLDITCSLEPVSGTNVVLGISIAVNGVIIPESTIIRQANTGDGVVMSIDWAATLNPNDEVTIWVQNNSNTTDIEISQLLLRSA